MSKKANYMYLPVADLEIDLRNDTAVESDVAQGKTFHKADGTQAVGTATGGGSSELFETLVDRSITEVDSSDLENITIIGHYAFSHCTNLSEIEIPGNIEGIDYWAFANTNIVTARLNEGVTDINYAFMNCTELTTVYLPSTLRNADCAFEGCTNLAEVYYNGTKTYWHYYFDDSNIFGYVFSQYLVIHCTDGDIEYNAPVGNMVVTFSSTLQLPPLEVPVPAEITKRLADYVTEYIGGEMYLDRVRTVTFPEGVVFIGNGFAGSCRGLNSVTFPSTLVVIESNAFAETKLTSIDLPATIESIGANAFANLNIMGSSSPINVEVTCRALVPPDLMFYALDVGSNATLTNIYVPSASVTDYQQDTNWSQYASIISAIV